MKRNCFLWRSANALAFFRTAYALAKRIAALDKLELLKPRAVIAGHKRPENDDDPRIIEETRSYFRDFMRLNEETTTAREFFDRMMKLHGDRANPGSLWGGVTAAKAHYRSKSASD